jgi:hypothetical protein
VSILAAVVEVVGDEAGPPFGWLLTEEEVGGLFAEAVGFGRAPGALMVPWRASKAGSHIDSGSRPGCRADQSSISR